MYVYLYYKCNGGMCRFQMLKKFYTVRLKFRHDVNTLQLWFDLLLPASTICPGSGGLLKCI